ncbi:MAG: ABC transporter substrate-binding protein, partial [Verrucomicrobiota bacterium]
MAGFLAAALGFTALLYGFGWAFRPDQTPAAPVSAAKAEELVRVEASRRKAETLDLAHPPVIARAVDYAAPGPQPWHPKGEAPVLAELVAEGRLPPVAERTGPEPVVLEGVDGIGRYGGTWYRLVNSLTDFTTVYWRLSGSNLVRWSPQGYPLVPHIAKGWVVSPDFRAFTFELRRGMRWSDGHLMTADDILFWYEHEVKYFNAQPKFLRVGAT